MLQTIQAVLEKTLEVELLPYAVGNRTCCLIRSRRGQILFDPKSHTAVGLGSCDDPAFAAESIADAAPAYVEDPYEVPFISSIEYYATSACNLGCSYCYLGPLPYRVESQDLEPTAAIQTLDGLFENDRIGPELTFLLIGGEPFVAKRGVFKMVEHVRGLCGKHRIQLHVRATSNGTLLTPDVIEWLKQNDVSVTLSADGQFQHENRPHKAGIDYRFPLPDLLDAIGPEMLSVRATLMPSQLRRQAEVYTYFHEAGVKAIYISAAHGLITTTTDISNNLLGITSLNSTCVGIGSFEGHLQDAYEALRYRRLARSHCSAGHAHVVLDSRGSLSACANLRDPQLHDQLAPYTYDVDADSVCGKCTFRYVCNAVGGGCRAWRILSHSRDPDPLECSASAARFVLALDRLLMGVAQFPTEEYVQTH